MIYDLCSEEFHGNDRSLAEGESTGQIKMLLDKKEKPIDVQILGPNAGDLMAQWVAVLNGNVKLATLAAAVHPYPTTAEINKRVAGNFLSEKVRKGLKILHHNVVCRLDYGPRHHKTNQGLMPSKKYGIGAFPSCVRPLEEPPRVFLLDRSYRSRYPFQKHDRHPEGAALVAYSLMSMRLPVSGRR